MQPSDVLDIIHQALRHANDTRINDVTLDQGRHMRQLIITTDDGTRKQVWVIDTDPLLESDPPE